MKSIGVSVIIVFGFLMMSAAEACAQPRFGILSEPTCWTTPGGRDSSITRLVLISTPGEKKILGYLDQYAQNVTVAADSSTFKPCFCEELPGYVYPPPGGIALQSIGRPVINPLDPKCIYTTAYDIEFAFEIGDVTATYNGGAVGSIQKSGATLIVESPDLLPGGTCNDFPKTFVVTVSNQYGSDSKTVIIYAVGFEVIQN